MRDSENANVAVIAKNDDTFIEEFLAEVRTVKKLRYLLFLIMGVAIGAMGEEAMDAVNHYILRLFGLPPLP